MVNPYAALLLVIPANVWLLTATSETRLAPPLLVGLVVLSLVPVALVVLSVAGQLGVGVTEIPWLVLLWVAGGQAGPLALACCALTAAAARGRAALRRAPARRAGRRDADHRARPGELRRPRARSAAPTRPCAAEPPVGRPLRVLKPRRGPGRCLSGRAWRLVDRPPTTMLDTTNLRSTVSSGRYVVDPFAVADALLARAGIATGPPEPRERPPRRRRQPRRCS